jgi:5-methyltetrahydrofolate--homocysteine methyltransferase
MGLETIYEAILTGELKTTKVETQAALAAGTSAADILHKACIPAMTEIGHLFEIGERFVPEMLVSAHAMQGAFEVLKPMLVKEKVAVLGTLVIGTVAAAIYMISVRTWWQ